MEQLTPRELYELLLEEYGEPEEPPELSGMEYLIETILSQNTNDVNRDKAYQNLIEKYDSYEEIENADLEELTDTIRIAGLGPTKAERIQGALKTVREYEGEYSLDFIEEMDIEEGKNWLTKIPGIGPKTAAIILCFGFDRPVIPVDTHVHRISRRFGLIPENASRKKAHKILEEKVPDDIKYPLHRLMITHGREACKARNPTCGETKLGKYCKYHQQVTNGDREHEELS